MLASWDLPASSGGEAFARALFEGESLDRLLDGPEARAWRPALEALAWAPPEGLALVELGADAQILAALLGRGLVFATRPTHVACPWEVVAAISEGIDLPPPCLAARFAAMDAAAFVAYREAWGLSGSGSRRGDLRALLARATDPAALASHVSELPSRLRDALHALLDLGGRPLDAALLGDEGLDESLVALSDRGLLFAEAGAYFLPVDWQEPLFDLRAAFVDGMLSKRLDAFAADSQPRDLPRLDQDLGPRLSACLAEEGGAGPSHDLAAALDIELPGGQRLLDQDDEAIVAHALRLLASGLPEIQDRVFTLLGVEPWARAALLVEGVSRGLEAGAPALTSRYRAELASALEKLGGRLEDVDALLSAGLPIVARALSGFHADLLAFLARAADGRARTLEDMADILVLMARRSAAHQVRELCAFGLGFAGRPPVAAWSRLRAGNGRREALGVLDGLVSGFLEPLGLGETDAGTLALSPVLRTAFQALHATTRAFAAKEKSS